MVKEITSVIVLLALCVPAFAVDLPNLVGNWTGHENGYIAENGSYKMSEVNTSLAIVEQKDRLFRGNTTYILNGKEVVEGFIGVIGLDNKTFYRPDFTKGYSFGTIISNDEIGLIYLQDGESWYAGITDLHRIK